MVDLFWHAKCKYLCFLFKVHPKWVSPGCSLLPAGLLTSQVQGLLRDLEEVSPELALVVNEFQEETDRFTWNP